MSAARYREWAAGPELTADVACLWASRPAGETLVLPDACIDIVWDGARLFVAGPDTGPVAAPAVPSGFYAGLRFRPGRAPDYLGVPADALADQRVALADLWGEDAAAALAAGLAEAARAGPGQAGQAGLGPAAAADPAGPGRGPAAAAQALAAAVSARRTGAAAPDPLIDALVAWLRRAPASARVVSTAGQALGAGERQLHRRCRAAVGYGPKTLERVLRFRRAERLALGGAGLGGAGLAGAGLAGVAAAAGYADQAHLTRECRRLAGRPPSDLFKTAGGTPG